MCQFVYSSYCSPNMLTLKQNKSCRLLTDALYKGEYYAKSRKNQCILILKNLALAIGQYKNSKLAILLACLVEISTLFNIATDAILLCIQLTLEHQAQTNTRF